MLRKLLKYEFKEMMHVMPFFYLIIAIFALISLLLCKYVGWFSKLSSVLLITAGAALIIITFVIIVMRFYKNLYGNEGYLMFTLPVKPHLLLVSKTISAFLWIIASIIVTLGALYVALYSLGFDIGKTFSEIKNLVHEFNLEKIIYLIVPYILILILYEIGLFFFAITVSNKSVFHDLGIAASFIVFIVTYVVLKVLESVASIFIPLSIKINMAGNMNAAFSKDNMLGFLIDSINAADKGIKPDYITIGLGGVIFIIIMTFVLFYINGNIMNKKVSLR